MDKYVTWTCSYHAISRSMGYDAYPINGLMHSDFIIWVFYWLLKSDSHPENCRWEEVLASDNIFTKNYVNQIHRGGVCSRDEPTPKHSTCLIKLFRRISRETPTKRYHVQHKYITAEMIRTMQYHDRTRQIIPGNQNTITPVSLCGIYALSP